MIEYRFLPRQELLTLTGHNNDVYSAVYGPQNCYDSHRQDSSYTTLGELLARS